MQPEEILFDPNDWVPNNPRLPVLVYKSVEAGDGETAAADFEARFAEHGWPAQWRDTVFDYHHYHSTAHEVLGIASGSAVLELGGPGARTIKVEAGDVVVLPAGTGHRRVGQSEDFLVVGAYPEGQSWDICRDKPSKAALERIATLPVPTRNPVTGEASWIGTARSAASGRER